MSFSVVDLFVFIIRRWWKMLIALACFGGLGIALAFLLPKRYRAEVKLLPVAQESGLVGAISTLQSQLGITGLTIPGAEGGEMLFYGEILRSQTITDYVMDSCSLLERLDVADRIKAREELAGMTAYKLTAPEQVFVIEVVGPDNVLVADIANTYAQALDHYLTHSSTTRGRHLREFIEGRLAQAEVDMEAAQDSLTEFQRKHKMPMLNPEIGGQIQAFAELKAQATQKELELEYMRSFSTINNPQYEAARREFAIIQAKLASLPPVASRYLELYRDFMVQQEIYMLLMQQYEQAKLMEAKDTPLISILERVEPPPLPYFPPKKLLVLAVLLVGVVLILAYSMIVIYWEHVLAHPETHEKMSRLRSEVKKSFGRRKR
ncbi:MAG: GNVR domain-containing protein [candidate division WOR-3 bacterium]|nr:GNVR domain-containing protein [candidate division WOR-3 bacterium]